MKAFGILSREEEVFMGYIQCPVCKIMVLVSRSDIHACRENWLKRARDKENNIYFSYMGKPLELLW